MNFFLKNKGRTDSLFDNSSIKVLIIGCLLIIAAMIFMSVSGMLIMERAVISKLKGNDMVNLAESFGAVIEGKIDRAVDASLMLSHDPEIINWIESGEKNDQTAQNLEEKMEDLVQGFGYETSFLVSNQSRHYWSYHDDKFTLLDTVTKEDPSDAWFFHAIGMGKEYEINIDYNPELGDTFVWINALSGGVDRPIAVTGLGMNLSSVINELIQEERKSKVRNDIWLVNSEGVIRLAKTSENLGKQIEEVLPPSLGRQISEYDVNSKQFEIDEYVNPQGDTYDIAYRMIKDTDWKLVVQIPRKETTGFLSSVALSMVVSGVIIILLILVTFIILSNRIANPYKRAVQLNKELETIVAERTDELQQKNLKIQDSIDYAHSIQQSILPSDEELRRSLKEYFVCFEPKDTVGGDFYWFKRGSKGLLLVVGDCTGHGVVGALMTTAVNAMLNQVAEEVFDDPARILYELDRRIKQFVRPGSAEEIIPYGLDAAVFYISDEGSTLFAGANLPAFLWDGEQIREAAPSSNTIDCMVRRKEKRFENRHFEYKQDNTFYVVTDGFREQPGGAQLLPFGKKRLLELLRAIAPLPMAEQKEALQRALKEYQGAGMRRDDVTVLSFKI